MYQKRNNELEILLLYASDYKQQYYLREISKRTKIPLKTVQNTLKNLEKTNIIKATVKGKHKYFTLNLSNIQTKFSIMQAELYKTKLFLERYTQCKPFIKNITSSLPIIVFGSFSKFTANKNSDLDVLIISAKETALPSHLLPNKIHQINVSKKAFVKALDKKEPLLKEVQASHIILNNHSFYVNAMWCYYGR